jgi:hypothetical protein
MPEPSITPKTLREPLLGYIRNKEERSNDEISTFARRDRKRGNLTSLYPIVSPRRALSNYAEHKGFIYKLMHLKEDYKPGRAVFFPNAQNYFGAKLKDKKLDSDQGIAIRTHNIGYAQYLTRILDHIEKNDSSNPDMTPFYEEVYHQIFIKIKNNERDGYFNQLNALFNHLNYEEKQKIFASTKSKLENNPNFLRNKEIFLDWSAENTQPNLYTRGEDYSYETLVQNKSDNNPNFQSILEALKAAKNPAEPISDNLITTPGANTSFTPGPSITLGKGARLGDNAMHMELETRETAFAAYKIKGKVSAPPSAIIGKDNAPLKDGWYQFVIMAETKNGIPEIRYYPCGEKQSGPALYQQMADPKKLTGNAVRDEHGLPEKIGDYDVTKPKGHSLRYDKFVAHSQLAGGQAVQSGGAFLVVNGQVKIIEDSSGHYASKENSAARLEPLRVAHDAFKLFDVIADDCVLERWAPFKGPEKVAKKLAAMLKNPIIQPSILKENTGATATVAENRASEPDKQTPTQMLLFSKHKQDNKTDTNPNTKDERSHSVTDKITNTLSRLFKK